MDGDDGIIVAADLTNVAPDEGHLPGLVATIQALRERVGRAAEERTVVSADAGYFSHANCAQDGNGLDLLIAAGRDDPAEPTTAKPRAFTLEQFGYDPARDAWQCPAGAWLERQRGPTGGRGRSPTHRYHAAPSQCAGCPLRQRCLKPGETHRVVVSWRGTTTGAMRYKLRQPTARRRYARRKVIVEPIFGQLKEDRGFASLSLRGLVLARAEFLLACLAHNLGKLLRVCPLSAPAPA